MGKAVMGWVWLSLGLACGGGGGGSDAGASDSGAPLDAGRVDAGSVDAGFVDAGLVDAGPDRQGIEGALASPDGPVNVPISEVLVTYVRPALGADLPGFFLQGAPAGPAIFVQTEPTVSAGDRVSLRATELETRLGYKRIIGIADLVVLSSDNDLSGLVQDVSDRADLVTSLSSYAYELVTIEVLITGTPEAGGAGFTRATVQSPSVMDEARLQLRLPTDLWTSLGPFAVGCSMRVEGTPLWPFNDVAQVSAWDATELTAIDCP